MLYLKSMAVRLGLGNETKHYNTELKEMIKPLNHLNTELKLVIEPLNHLNTELKEVIKPINHLSQS